MSARRASAVTGMTVVAATAAVAVGVVGAGVTWSDELVRVVLLRDFNTRVVVLGVTALGLASGLIGTFLLLRKRALTADAISHATLPGIAGAFIVASAAGGDGKTLPVLLLGAFICGLLGMGGILLIRHTTRLKDDAALGIVLSVMFGLGLGLLRVIQEMPQGNAAGLDRFIFGRAAVMLPGDAAAIGAAALAVAVACTLLFKEFRLLCFDEAYAGAQGWPVRGLDVALMGLVVVVTVIALQAVGLVLAVALLIMPAAAARFWTDRLASMAIVAAGVGMASGYAGATISALAPRLPTGPVIVLVCGGCFVLSLLLGRRRGLVVRLWTEAALRRRIARQHLLRAVYERSEAAGAEPVARAALLEERSWSTRGLAGVIRSARRDDLLETRGDGSIVLTDAGRDEARRLVRNHRLWEAYLIHYADVAPSHVDRSADEVEHVIGADLVARLEGLLAGRVDGAEAMPASPHPLSDGEATR